MSTQEWRPDELERRRQVEAGGTAVANLNKRGGDARLIAWARSEELYVYIGRISRDNPGRWGNWFVEGKDGTRDEVCDRFAERLPNDLERMARLAECKGRVLACFCYPKRCHGEEIIKAMCWTATDQRG
jgi:hypothetical protein